MLVNDGNYGRCHRLVAALEVHKPRVSVVLGRYDQQFEMNGSRKGLGNSFILGGY